VGLAEYERLLPGGESLRRLTAIVRNYVGDAFEWEANLVLKGGDVPETRLGESGRLGLTTWIGRRPPGRDADDLYLMPPEAA
jgi:type VI secretion system protein ImpH